MTPPKTLFRYLWRRLAQTVFISSTIFALLIMLIDFVENFRFAGKVVDGDLWFAAQLTLMRMPSLALTLLPFVVLFSSIWTFHQLNRRSEFSVMRAAGMSIWHILVPPSALAFLLGVVVVVAIDPLASYAMSKSEETKILRQSVGQNAVELRGDGLWIRQEYESVRLVINAQSFDRPSATLAQVRVWQFAKDNSFVSRYDAAQAVLTPTAIELKDAQILENRQTQRPLNGVFVIPTSIGADDLEEKAVSPSALSLWTLPKAVALAKAVGLPTSHYFIRFHDLFSLPLKLLAMMLIAAMFAFRSTRANQGGQLFGLSVLAGFSLYIFSEVSTALGEAEAIAPFFAAWAPAFIAILIAISGVMHLEER